jgi:hypothetical protein
VTSSYLRTTGDEITHEFNANQPVVYLALRVIGQILTAGTDTTLPFVVYRVIKNRLSHIKNDANGYNAIHYAHLGIAVLVVLLGVIASFLFSYGQIFIEIHTTEEAYGINISNWYMYIQLTYTSVYCGVTLEMLACAVFIFKKSGPTNTQSRVS